MNLAPAPFRDDLAQGPEGGRAYWATTSDGVRIRLGHYGADAARGTVLLFPGRTEFVEKYGRTAADLAQGGYHTLVVDWRGQGLADRLLSDVRTGHVHYFEDYQDDVTAMLAAAEALDLPKPWHLLGHSMGGCIGLRALMNGLPVDTCVFTGPMWGIRMSAPLRATAWALGWGSARVGLEHKIAPGMNGDSYVTVQPFEGNQLTTDAEAYAHLRKQIIEEPGFHLGGPSLRWLYESLAECRILARRPSPPQPCLTFCGALERIVDVAAIKDRMARWPGSRLEMIPDTEHEVLMEGVALRRQITALMLAHFAHSNGHDTAQSA